MTLRTTALSLALIGALAGCGGPAGGDATTTPKVAPTEVAAVKTPPPQYPIELGCTGVGGTTTLKVVVGIDGRPSDVTQVSSSGNAQLDQQALSAVRGWQFNAATRNGQKIPATIQVPVSFNPPNPRPDECFAVEERMRRGG